VRKQLDDYVIRLCAEPGEIDAAQWNALLQAQDGPTPFMRHEYLAALHDSGSATAATGWTPCFLTLWHGRQLHAACALYLKDHSYGEYVFDWAWANAYEQHGLAYYPKGLVAVPFTPVPGSRLLARDAQAREALVRELVAMARKESLSSLHLLFLSDADIAACSAAGLMPRHTVQFHWANPGWPDFDAFLASLAQDKRKKIRQEKRKVAEAGVTFRVLEGTQISEKDWDFFYRCYERTYREHGNPPYLRREFFRRMGRDMPAHWLLFIGQSGGRDIAASLIALSRDAQGAPTVAYGRYWGALERVDCLHFEACYYQPLQCAWSTASSGSRVARKASTRWRALSCRSRHTARTGWRTPPSPMRWSASSSARGRASSTTWATWRRARRSAPASEAPATPGWSGSPESPRTSAGSLLSSFAGMVSSTAPPALPMTQAFEPSPHLPPPGLKLLAMELRAPWEFGSLLPAWPVLRKASTGGGHPVLVFSASASIHRPGGRWQIAWPRTRRTGRPSRRRGCWAPRGWSTPTRSAPDRRGPGPQAFLRL